MCKAILEQGKNKGTQCWRPALGNGYCGKHQKQAEHEANTDKRKCLKTRCNNFLEKESMEEYCPDCKVKIEEYEKNFTKCKALLQQGEVKGQQCTRRAKSKGYCMKHQRELYHEEEKEKNIRYCDVERGCMNLVAEGKASCRMCLIDPHRKYLDYIHGADKRGYKMELTEEQFTDLIYKPCYYCSYYVEKSTIGVDRYDNNKDYTAENCVPCCKWCNRMKVNYDTEEFIMRCQRIAANFAGKNIQTRPAP
jgi:hypothetical protein